ncbi:MAG: hypothetical protein NWE95_08985 [Candidatus Bathyarchaeota archaeon]|nr:hypothetical protein [Candidatus Bathyarchaeota archaeon]
MSPPSPQAKGKKRTGTSLAAWGQDEFGYFEEIYITHQRGLGGYYDPAPPLVHMMDCMDEWYDHYMGYRIWYDYNEPVPWDTDDPFGVGFEYEVQTSNDIIYTAVGLYGGGTTDSYFPWPPAPYIMWFCEGSLAQVYSYQ